MKIFSTIIEHLLVIKIYISLILLVLLKLLAFQKLIMQIARTKLKIDCISESGDQIYQSVLFEFNLNPAIGLIKLK